jgi:hypothetical protein
MKTWDLHVYPKDGKALNLKAELYYHSDQVMRIKVFGKNRSISLQNNYPLIKKRKMAFKWKIIEGAISDPSLFESIMGELERMIKKDFPPDQLY